MWVPTMSVARVSTLARVGVGVVVLALSATETRAQNPSRVDLGAGWRVQSSANVTAAGDAISTTRFAPTGWYPTAVPSTVLAALVANKVFPDPYVGMNLRSIPGTTYPIGRIFAVLPMADNSPYRVPWWYRRTFELPASMRGKHVAIHFDGINYRANVWLNGIQVARSDSMVGTYRLFEIDVTEAVKAVGTNVLAVEVSAPSETALAMNWVDWNPAPPDKDMGLWRPVYLTASGPVQLRYPHVVAHVDTATLKSADLSISVEARNLSDARVSGILRARIGDIAVNRTVDLAAHDSAIVRLNPDEFRQLHIRNPRLWWPVGMGAQPLYDLAMTFTIAGATSDRSTTRFGIRETTSEFTPGGGRLFRVNGRRMLIRGGGWAPDMLMRATVTRQDAELRYARDMHLNTIRLEGKLEDENFFDLADKYGLLVLAGWSCCDQWEKWKSWSREDTVVALHSQRDQIRRLRNRASILAWLDGSDNPPPAEIESAYIAILREYDWQNPVISSASGTATQVTGPSGVKMSGPYDWVPPEYWMIDSTHGGASGFNTETSPGAAVPPIESLRRMFGGAVPWPIDSMWNYHAASGRFNNFNAFGAALAARYGDAKSAEDFAEKSQLMTYEGERAMFEAYSRNRGRSTGVVQWMLNDAWPGLWWHLYDYYLRPAGGYFGTKKALEPVHAMYSYDDRSIAVANDTRVPIVGATLTARMIGFDGSVLYRADTTLTIPPDSVVRSVVMPPARSTGTATYFVDLRLTSRDHRTLSTNFYWLSRTMDELNFPKSTYYITPVTAYADFTALAVLPPTIVRRSLSVERVGATETARVTLRNTGKLPAFFMRLQITAGKGGSEILPVIWSDNYVTVLPGETRTLTATYSAALLAGKPATLVVSGSNLMSPDSR